IPAHEHLPIRLLGDRRNTIVRPCSRIETAVQTAVGIETRNSVAVHPVDGAEITADEHLAIRLHGDRRSSPVRYSCGDIETAVPTSVGIEPENEPVIDSIATEF